MHFHTISRGLIVLAVSALVSVPALAANGQHNDERTRTYADRNTCSGAHGELKRAMKDTARAHCRGNAHGSGNFNTLRQEDYTKVSCQKNKEGRQVTSVRVEGALSYLCSS